MCFFSLYKEAAYQPYGPVRQLDKGAPPPYNPLVACCAHKSLLRSLIYWSHLITAGHTWSQAGPLFLSSVQLSLIPPPFSLSFSCGQL